MINVDSSTPLPVTRDSCSMSLLKCIQKNSGRFTFGLTKLTNSGILSWLWHEHHNKAECMMALMMHRDGGERPLSGAGMDVLDSVTPRV